MINVRYRRFDILGLTLIINILSQKTWRRLGQRAVPGQCQIWHAGVPDDA